MYILQTLLISHFFSKKYFNLYNVYTYIFNVYREVIINNFILSLKFNFFSKTLLFLTPNKKLTTSKTKISIYVNPIRYLSVPYYKTNLNKLFFLNKLLLIFNYYSYVNTFFLKKPETYLNLNHYFIMYQNLFYFKIKNQ